MVDALALHDHMHLLGPILANPAVLKVETPLLHPVPSVYCTCVGSPAAIQRLAGLCRSPTKCVQL